MLLLVLTPSLAMVGSPSFSSTRLLGDSPYSVAFESHDDVSLLRTLRQLRSSDRLLVDARVALSASDIYKFQPRRPVAPPRAHGPRVLALGARCLRPRATRVGVPLRNMLLLLRRMRRWLRRLRRLRTTMTKTRKKTTQMTRRRSRSYRRLPASSATSLGRPRAAFLGRTPTFASSLVMRFLRRTGGAVPNSSRVWHGK